MSDPAQAFFYVRSSEGRQGLAKPVGRSREDDKLIIERTMYGGLIEDWPERTYEMKGEFADLQPELRSLKLCSPALRTILEEHKTEADVLQWLPVAVRGETGETRPYSVLHFPEFPDVVDPTRSTFEEFEGQKFYNYVALDVRKSAPYAVMPSPERFPTAFMVGQSVMKAILNARLTGLAFVAARIA